MKQGVKKWISGIAFLITIVIIATLIFLPAAFERSVNVVDGKALPTIREDAKILHNKLIIVDLHGDTLLWKRSMLDIVDYGHIDLERMQKGNVALQVFSSVTKTPKGQNYDNNSADSDNITTLVIAQLQPLKTWFSLLNRSLYHAEKRDEAVKKSNNALSTADNSEQIIDLIKARSNGEKKIGAMLSIEGLQNLEGKHENLDILYDAGFRMAGLAHFFDNELAGSLHGEQKYGLTKFGREIVTVMEQKGMIVDIAHLSRKSTKDVLAMASRPVVYSHGGVQAKCNVNRNLTDTEIQAIAKNGGLIGIGYWEGAICDTSPKAIAAAMKHIRDLVGVKHVALGSDFDGTITTRFDTSGLVHITQALIDAEFTDEEIIAVMGGNAITFLTQGLKPRNDIAK